MDLFEIYHKNRFPFLQNLNFYPIQIIKLKMFYQITHLERLFPSPKHNISF